MSNPLILFPHMYNIKSCVSFFVSHNIKYVSNIRYKRNLCRSFPSSCSLSWRTSNLICFLFLKLNFKPKLLCQNISWLLSKYFYNYMKIFLEVCQYIFQNYVIKIYFPSSCSLSWITSSLSEIFKKTGRIGFPDKLIWFSNPILLELRWLDIFRKLCVWFMCVICCFCQEKYPKLKHLDYEIINYQTFLKIKL